MTRKRRKKKTISKVFMSILLVISILFLILTFMLNVVPLKYMLIVVVVLVLLELLLIKLMFSKRKYKRLISYIISSIISLFLLLGSIYEINTLGFFGNFGKYNYKTLNYNVLVLNDSSYKEIKDLKNKTIGVLIDDHEEDTKNAIKELEKKIKFKKEEYDNSFDLIESLIARDLDAILIEESKYTILTEENSDLANDLKVLYTVSIDVKVENINKEVDVTKESFNIYISGVDSYGKITSVSRSDVNIVATVNPDTNEVVLTSIPRDYYVQLHGTTGYKDKLTHAGIYGIDKSVQTIEDLLDIDINYYVKVNFTSLIKVVDELDGITVNSNYSFTSMDGYRYTKGINELNGKEALSFVRERKAFEGGDRVRGENQQLVLAAIIDKALSPKIITKYNNLLNALEGKFLTNMNDSDITSLIKRQLEDNKSWNISFINLDGSDGYDYTYSHSASKLYVMIPDEESVESAKAKLHNILN